MNYKIVSIFFVTILITAVLSVSLCTIAYTVNISVDASADVTCGRAPLNVSFSCRSLGSDMKIKKYLWEFDDGHYSEESAPKNTYFNEGMYLASVTIWDENGRKATDTVEIHVIEYYNPIASISANRTCGKPPLNISFKGGGYDVDGSNSDFEYHWDFDDGTTSKVKNPYHVFKETGTYYVRLEIRDKDGLIDTDMMEINIINNYQPSASISADTTNGKTPLLVQFEGNCEDIDDTTHSYTWFFEDTVLAKNRISNENNPSHRFWFPGTYNVTLTVKDDDGAEDTETIIITVDDSLFSWGLEKFITLLINKMLYEGIENFFISFIGNIIGKIMSLLGKIGANILV